MSTRPRLGLPLLLAVGVVVSVAAVVLLYYPQMKDVRRWQREERRKQAELVRMAGLAQQRLTIEAEHAASIRLARRAQVSPAPDRGLADLVARIGQAVDGSGATRLELTVSTSNPADDTVGVALQVRGSYAQIRALVRSLELLPRGVSIERMTLIGTDGAIVADFALRAPYTR